MVKQHVMEMKSVTITEKGQIAIPKDMRAMKGFGEGSKVVIIAFKDRLELRPLRIISEAMEPYLLSEKTWAKDWDTPEEDEAWKDL